MITDLEEGGLWGGGGEREGEAPWQSEAEQMMWPDVPQGMKRIASKSVASLPGFQSVGEGGGHLAEETV